MIAGFDVSSENDGITILTFTAPMDHAMLAAILDVVPQLLPETRGKLLVDRRDQEMNVSLSKAIDFGLALGRALLARKAKVAVLRHENQVQEDLLAAQIYNSGVSLAQFERSGEARAWLSGALS